MLPQDGDEDEYGGNEDKCQCDLGDGSRGERLDVNLGACLSVALLVPAWECRQQDKAEEGKNDGHNEEVGEDDGILESRCDPDQIERILVHGDALDQSCRVVGTDVVAAVLVDTYTKVAYTHAKLCIADNVCDGSSNTGIDLFGGVGGCVLFVPHGNEEDAGYERRRGGASCQ